MSDCIEWQGWRDKQGYGQTTVNGTHHHAHRAEWLKKIGPIPKDMHVLHSCDNPSCVNVDHLFLGTRSDNMIDMYKKGRGRDQNGQDGNGSKLTDLQVTEIKLSLKCGVRQTWLADHYGVCQPHISDINTGKKRIVR